MFVPLGVCLGFAGRDAGLIIRDTMLEFSVAELGWWYAMLLGSGLGFGVRVRGFN